MHLTSLRGPHAIGDLGPRARAFVDFLAAAGQGLWQLLPVNPTGKGNSPYSGPSAFAGNPDLISLEDLVQEGLLNAGELPACVETTTTDYVLAKRLRAEALRRAFKRFHPDIDYQRFERASASWLPEYALYETLCRARPGVAWMAWPEELALRDPPALRKVAEEQEAELQFVQFIQYLFFRQWAGGARMNRPGETGGNWEWRVDEQAFDRTLAEKLRAVARVYGRLA